MGPSNWFPRDPKVGMRGDKQVYKAMSLPDSKYIPFVGLTLMQVPSTLGEGVVVVAVLVLLMCESKSLRKTILGHF